MTDLSLQQSANYFNRSYKAVDGLWFMKVEEKYGFDSALELDNEVWKVIPKIQARMIKSFLGLEKGSDSLLKSLVTKLELEGFKFMIEKKDNGFRIKVTSCPWLNLMIKSGRENLAKVVGKTVCTTEYQVWASEFGKNIEFNLILQKCNKSESCILEFVSECEY
ncbi:hypothetical protein AC477_03460 [miscellaneous Crenarchaeota group-1 archaeon SG8-32-1]|uniref:4-vinyl reductase 4VR domain-containing protein n=1 Tax=miscellaneous Crenarchaeota group-1 archaeon SG8-32-1 TaxID=1685124 RepID=A0A0M0BUM8_9ARCH|nr:MAG: hypothetical protein AC477_03460 [miscellaneous Crenarchaeota group-1 archaeon SG8-32-1]